MATTACIKEIFSSLQGEGPYLGEKMTFIRFANCRFGCKWCDTDHLAGSLMNVFKTSAETPSETIENPVGITTLIEIVSGFTDKTISITGGEPLEQTDFLEEFLPYLHRNKTILLETNGVNFAELKRVINFIDIVSMDIKLPSSTGRDAFWEEHKNFLTTSLGHEKEIYIKLVVTSSTTDRDINEAIKLISATNRFVPVTIQPVTPTEEFHETVSEERLLSMKRLIGSWLPNVSITPQMHREWGVK